MPTQLHRELSPPIGGPTLIVNYMEEIYNLLWQEEIRNDGDDDDFVEVLTLHYPLINGINAGKTEVLGSNEGLRHNSGGKDLVNGGPQESITLGSRGSR